MIKNHGKLRLWWYGFFILVSLIILADFIMPGRVVIDNIIDVKKDRRQFTMLHEIIITHIVY